MVVGVKGKRAACFSTASHTTVTDRGWAASQTHHLMPTSAARRGAFCFIYSALICN